MSNKAENKQANKKRRASVKLDEAVKLLFEVSKDLLVTTLNSLFNENFDPDSVEVEKTATEYPKFNFDIIRADMFLKVTENMKPYHYHVEIQTEPSGDMIVRLFEYDLQKAIDNYRLENKKIDDEPVFCMPKSLVIHLKDGKDVPAKQHSAKLILADGQIISYTVPVLRYFEYDKNRLIKENLYTLLPLQLFLLRAELDKLTADNSVQARHEATAKAIALTEGLTHDIMKLYDNEKFDINDLDKIISALNELFLHLRNRYNMNEELSKGAENMIKTFYNEKLAKKLEKQAEKRVAEKVAIEVAEKIAAETAEKMAMETATEMLMDGEPIHKIIKYTKLTEKEIHDIEKYRKK